MLDVRFAFLRAALALAASAAAVSVQAHDTWFEPLPANSATSANDSAQMMLALGTGNYFPRQEYAIGPEHLRAHGCRVEDGTSLALDPVRATPTALVVGIESRSKQASSVSCWAQLIPFEIELPIDKVNLYLREIRPPQSVLNAWTQMRARGVVWKERYTKNARIEIARDTANSTDPAMPKPAPMGMDVLLESGLQIIRPGDQLTFRVLRDGQPLPDFAVELRSDRSRLGIWRKTDADGRVRIEAPLPGHWVLRGTDLRLSETQADTWESRFVTLAFQIASP